MGIMVVAASVFYTLKYQMELVEVPAKSFDDGYKAYVVENKVESVNIELRVKHDENECNECKSSTIDYVDKSIKQDISTGIGVSIEIKNG